MGKETAMNPVVGADIVSIALDQGKKSMENIIVIRGMNTDRDRGTDIATSLVESAAKDPGPETDTPDLVDEMGTIVSATPSLKAPEMTTQSIKRRVAQGWQMRYVMGIGSQTIHRLEVVIVRAVARVAIKPHGKTCAQNHALGHSLVEESRIQHLEEEPRHHIAQRRSRRKTFQGCDPVLVDATDLAHHIDLIAEDIESAQAPVWMIVHQTSSRILVQAA
jgi:hypothetical protein